MILLRKTLWSIGLAALLLSGSAVVAPRLLGGDRADYSHVVSIKHTAEYQEPALLEQAWALPVATLYRANIRRSIQHPAGDGRFCRHGISAWRRHAR